MCVFRRFAFVVFLGVCIPLLHAQDNSAIPDAHLTFTTIDVPGAGITNVYGINSGGDMVGNYATADNTPSHGFLFSDGNFTTLDYPGGDASFAVGINDHKLVSGYAYLDQNTSADGFLYDGTGFTPVRAPGKTATIVDGINNAGMVVGGTGTVFSTKGFEHIGARFKTVSPPGNHYQATYATGINNLGDVVGWMFGDVGYSFGFIYTGGKFRRIRVPGSGDTTKAWSINDSGIVVGFYFSGSGLSGFALINGKYKKINFPGASNTALLGINDGGQVVGSYSFDGSTWHGFVTGPITAADFSRGAL